MNTSLLSAILIALFCSNVVLSQEIPSYIRICNQSDPDLSGCIRKSILSLRPYLKEGIPELDIPSLNPFLVPEIKVAQESGIPIEAKFSNISIYGAMNFRLRSVRSDVESDKFRMKIWFPELAMQGQYNIQGILLMLPIRGHGMAYGNFSDIDGVLSMKLKRVKKNGKEHYKVDFLQTEFNIGGATARLDNLFNGRDKDLAATMNQFINENWRMVAAEIRPALEKIISEQLTDVADKFFAAFPISKLFKF